MDDLITAFGLMLVLEGLIYALFPAAMRRAIVELLSLPVLQIRQVAIGIAFVGLGVVWLVRG